MKQNVSNSRRDAVRAPGTAIEPGASAARGNAGQGQAQFTARQLEVLALLCEGHSNKVICRRLSIAPGTVKVHVSCILRELGVMSRLQAVVAARTLGFCTGPVVVTPKEFVRTADADRAAKAARARDGTSRIHLEM